MRVLLVNPPFPESYYNRELYFPSSLMYLASALQHNGEEVQILDLRLPKHEASGGREAHFAGILTNAIRSFSPELIGLGCLFSGFFTEVLRLSGVCKAAAPDVPVVIGGIHPTIYAREILSKCPTIDWVVLAEGEETVVQLVNQLKAGRKAFTALDGFAWRSEGRIVCQDKIRFIENPDTIRFPAYDLIAFDDYVVDTSNWFNPKGLPIGTSVPILSSRSCPMRCSFCSMFKAMGPHWRPRSPKNVVDEIEWVYHHYQRRHFSFIDDNLSLDKSRVLDICRQIRDRKLDLQFETPNGLAIKSLDEEVLDALVGAGMVRTYLAIESGSDYIRNDVMHKRLPRDKIFEIIRIVKKYKNMNVAAFFIMGMPEDTVETLEDTYRMILEIDVDRVFLMNLVPFPGTKVFDQAVRDGLLIGFDHDDLFRVSDRYFTNYDRFFLKPYRLEIADLKAFREKCERLPCVKRPARSGLAPG